MPKNVKHLNEDKLLIFGFLPLEIYFSLLSEYKSLVFEICTTQNLFLLVALLRCCTPFSSNFLLKIDVSLCTVHMTLQFEDRTPV